MEQLMWSALCGSAFVGGAAVTVTMVAFGVSVRDKAGREELNTYWRTSIAKQAEQVDVLTRLAIASEKMLQSERR